MFNLQVFIDEVKEVECCYAYGFYAHHTKAFHFVKHTKLWQLLIKELYRAGQEPTVTVNEFGSR